MLLGDIPGFTALAAHQQWAVFESARIVPLPRDAPVALSGFPAHLTWVLLEGTLVAVGDDGRPHALLDPVSVLPAVRSVYCATPALLLAIPLHKFGHPPQLAGCVSRVPPVALAAIRHDIELSLSWLAPLAPRKLLEVGAGVGFFSGFLADVCTQLTITDPLAAALDVAAERLNWGTGRAPQTVCCPGEALALPEASYDVVASRMALHHMNAVQAFLSEARRVLRPGGMLLATDLLGPEDAATRQLLNERERRLDPTHRGVLSREQLTTLLAAAGFVVQRLERTSVRTSLGDLGARGGCPPATIAATAAWLAQLTAPARASLRVQLGDDPHWIDERFVVLCQGVPAGPR